jgi:predicted Ser/Thr protein kinase
MKTHLGHYEIVSELGRGGMGVVYKGYEPALGRHVAIKELSPSLAHDPNLVERFLREARSMAALSDPHIIQVYFIGTDEATQQPFFAMEFIDGESLSGTLKREGKLTVENALKFMHQTAQGLATAHDKGVIHRDIKPGNLMLTQRGQVKIADFGIALATQDISKKLTSTGEFVGTPGYLSPEVCLGKIVDQRSDIFSLGIVLFEMLSGKTPFTDESPLGLMLEVVKAEIPDIRGLNAEVDPQTAAILTRMVAKDPNDRFQSCHDLAAALEAHPMVAKGGTIKFAVPKAPANNATMVGTPAPASQPRAVTPPPVVGRAATPAPVAAVPVIAAAAPVHAEAPTHRSGVRPSVLERQGKSSSPVLPLAIAAALVLMLGGGAYAFRGPLGQYVSGFTAGFSGDDAYEQGKAVGQASNPVGTSQAANGSDPTTAATNAATNATAAATTAATIAAQDDKPPVSDTAITPSAPVGDANVASTANQTSAATPAIDNGATPTVATQAPAANEDTRMAAADDGRSSQESSPAIKRLLAARNDRREVASNTPPREVAAPSTPRIAVVTIGDEALTGPARQRIEERLSDAGFDVIDTSLVSGVEGRGDLAAILRALRRDATVAIVVRADGVGSAPITFHGQVDTMYTAHLGVRAYLVGENRPLGPGFREQVNFTGLSAAAQAEEAIGPRLDRLLGDLASYRRRRG